jgi:hypothetical protein
MNIIADFERQKKDPQIGLERAKSNWSAAMANRFNEADFRLLSAFAAANGLEAPPAPIPRLTKELVSRIRKEKITPRPRTSSILI